jgi:hypothetical protein
MDERGKRIAPGAFLLIPGLPIYNLPVGVWDRVTYKVLVADPGKYKFENAVQGLAISFGFPAAGEARFTSTTSPSRPRCDAPAIFVSAPSWAAEVAWTVSTL